MNKEEYALEEKTLEQKIIFDNTIFEQIKEKELDLSVDKILEVPTIKNWFKRQNEEYYVVSQKEHIIDCKYTKGKAQIPILNKKLLNKEIQVCIIKVFYIFHRYLLSRYNHSFYNYSFHLCFLHNIPSNLFVYYYVHHIIIKSF